MKEFQQNEMFVSYELATRLKEKGFDIPCIRLKNNISNIEEEKNWYNWNDVDMFVSIPLYQQVVDWLDLKGYNISIKPEYYYEGINWNWQIFWYLPQEEWTEFLVNDGTMMYGDNGEYNTRLEATIAAIEKALELIKL